MRITEVGREKTEVGGRRSEVGNGIFNGDHKDRLSAFIEILKSRNESGPLTVGAAENFIVLADCIKATLRSFLIVEEMRERLVCLTEKKSL